MKPAITIAGGGLAGLTLGIGLRQEDVPVTIFEAGKYPRHKVCGEFISGRGLEVLDRLGLSDALLKAGAIPATSAVFFADSNQSKPRELVPPALCLSRFKMDAVLAGEFQKLGGDLREGERVETQPPNNDRPIVLACGRRPQGVEKGWRWFGIKAHAANIPMQADLEMHASPHSYIGLCRLADHQVNICGLFRSRPGSNPFGAHRKSLLSATKGTPLHEKLTQAAFDESSFCAVAGLALAPRQAENSPECCIGDALTMIPPVTGNGMSMAFESAEMAIAPLTRYHRGDLSWENARQKIAMACDNAFRRRLLWARFLQWMMFAPLLRGRLGALALRNNLLWRVMLSSTR